MMMFAKHFVKYSEIVKSTWVWKLIFAWFFSWKSSWPWASHLSDTGYVDTWTKENNTRSLSPELGNFLLPIAKFLRPVGWRFGTLSLWPVRCLTPFVESDPGVPDSGRQPAWGLHLVWDWTTKKNILSFFSPILVVWWESYCSESWKYLESGSNFGVCWFYHHTYLYVLH